MIKSPAWQRPLATLVLCGAVVVSLQGCVGMALGGAVVGTLAATDRRTLGAQTEDKAIIVKGETRMHKLVGDAGACECHQFQSQGIADR